MTVSKQDLRTLRAGGTNVNAGVRSGSGKHEHEHEHEHEHDAIPQTRGLALETRNSEFGIRNFRIPCRIFGGEGLDWFPKLRT